MDEMKMPRALRRFLRTLSEGKRQMLQRYPELAEQIDRLNDAGITGAYIDWAVKVIVDGADIDEVIPSVTSFIENRHLLSPEKRNIQQYSSFEEFVQAMEDIGQMLADKQSEQQFIAQVNANTKRLIDNSKVLLVQVFSKPASWYYGRGTKWCIAAGTPENGYVGNYFDGYYKHCNIYQAINRTNPAKPDIHRAIAILVNRDKLTYSLWNAQDINFATGEYEQVLNVAGHGFPQPVWTRIIMTIEKQIDRSGLEPDMTAEEVYERVRSGPPTFVLKQAIDHPNVNDATLILLLSASDYTLKQEAENRLIARLNDPATAPVVNKALIEKFNSLSADHQRSFMAYFDEPTIEHLARTGSAEAQMRLAGISSKPDLIDDMIKSGNRRTFGELIKNPNITERQLEMIIQKDDQMLEEMLNQARKHDHLANSEVMANAVRARVEKEKNDSRSSFMQVALGSLYTPLDVIEALNNDPSYPYRLKARNLLKFHEKKTQTLQQHQTKKVQ